MLSFRMAELCNELAAFIIAAVANALCSHDVYPEHPPDQKRAIMTADGLSRTFWEWADPAGRRLVLVQMLTNITYYGQGGN